jgi:RNA-directed DNA polymerase
MLRPESWSRLTGVSPVRVGTGVARLLAELQADLREGTYRPAPARRADIPKPDGSKRPLGMTVRDRMAQAAKIMLEPVFEADFLPSSFGFRPRRSAVMAMERLRTGFIAGCQFVEDWFNGHGLYRLRCTIRYPKAA